MIDLEYAISFSDVVKKIKPPVIKQISKNRGWIIFSANLNVSEESHSDFSFNLTDSTNCHLF